MGEGLVDGESVVLVGAEVGEELEGDELLD